MSCVKSGLRCRETTRRKSGTTRRGLQREEGDVTPIQRTRNAKYIA